MTPYIETGIYQVIRAEMFLPDGDNDIDGQVFLKLGGVGVDFGNNFILVEIELSYFYFWVSFQYILTMINSIFRL